MATQTYFGYLVCGKAQTVNGTVYEAFGEVQRDGKVVQASGSLGYHRTAERAIAEGIAWGKVWIDMKEQGYTDVLHAGRQRPMDPAQI